MSRWTKKQSKDGVYPFIRTPLRRGIIPTLTLVRDSLESMENVDKVIEDARVYVEKFT